MKKRLLIAAVVVLAVLFAARPAFAYSGGVWFSWSSTETTATFIFHDTAGTADKHILTINNRTYEAKDRITVKGLGKSKIYKAAVIPEKNGEKGTPYSQYICTRPKKKMSRALKKDIQKRIAKGQTEIVLKAPVDSDEMDNYLDVYRIAYPMQFMAKRVACERGSGTDGRYSANGSKAPWISDVIVVQAGDHGDAAEAKKIEKAVAGYVNAAKKGKTTRKKLWNVYNRMAKLCHYDWKGYNAYFKYEQGLKGGKNDPSIFKPETILLKHKGVCQAYAESYTAIVTRMGIEAETVVDTSPKVDHAWCKVKVGKKWYYIDPTRGDYGKKGSKKWFMKRSMHGHKL